ncbi:MAG TPA: DUF1793 domain-containing protein, partial [Verrucomicrobiae bacterium]|nr:DUF1793 domain-containing protein [Verrucomicrobiae bacterium]
DLCRMRGDLKTAQEYAALAKTDAAHWIKVANDGDHYRLAFDKPGTWSQKYNLVWDRLLGLNIFPPSVAGEEVAYYRKVMQRYGVPLDSRTHLTKTDWSFWSATLADNQADFEAIISPIFDYLNSTTTRDPISDSYETDKIDSGGMHARPVVGGLFIKMLADRDLWRKWARRDKMRVGKWADLPAAPVIEEVLATSRDTAANWRYTTLKPADAWATPAFDDHGWSEGAAGFGTEGTPGIKVRTTWDTGDIWLRRDFIMPKHLPRKLAFYVYHDEDVEVYVNGVLGGTESGFTTGYVPLEINREARALLKPGAHVTIAMHCHQTGGGQGVDLGFATISKHRSR